MQLIHRSGRNLNSVVEERDLLGFSGNNLFLLQKRIKKYKRLVMTDICNYFIFKLQ